MHLFSKSNDQECKGPIITSLRVSSYKVPTQTPESDGTLQWDSTTLVLVEVEAGAKVGVGYTYADPPTARLIESKLREKVLHRDAFAVTAIWQDMVVAIRNLGRPGLSSMAISAIDTALWDLKAKILGLPLVTLWGQLREGAPVYGSGGFTSYSQQQLEEQLGGWASQGLRRVKMKIGRHPEQDPERVRIARGAIGPETELFVDANGAYSAKQALHLAEKFLIQGVRWFEEPVSSDNLEGLALLRERVPAPMEVAAGEYGYDLYYFQKMLSAKAVDVLQADVTRCGGFTGYLQVASLCDALEIPLSGHCAPSLHLHANCVVPRFRHQEYFFDHVEIEKRFFDGFREPIQGAMYPDLSRPGIGIEMKKRDAEQFAA